MRNLFIGCYNKSVILTYLGGISSVLGIYFAFNHKISFALICLIISAICDLFDGSVARKCKRNETEKKFGVEIDSLTDILSFGIFPACILYSISNTWYSVVIASIYVILSITRLAWFNIINNEEESKKYFRGLPVAYIAIIYPVCYLLNMLITGSIYPVVYIVLTFVTSILFVVNFKLRKPYGIWYILYALLAIAVTIGIIFVGVI